ncbi:MAG TPA: metalloregulator ArsR/SmtB family transcription factor [Pyrinomonadaceae bacterium]|nr:metalloregulator ArsR/SmtB family transcription factor [Pyrinomonadaceae bacterium]
MNEQLNDVEHLYLAFGDKTRLQLLYLLRDGEVSVNSLTEALNTSQPKVSRHLAYLRTMKVVTTRREGKSIYYKLDLPTNTFGASVVEETINWIDALTGNPPGPKQPKAERAAPPLVAQPLFESEELHEAELFTEPEAEYSEREMEVYLL